MKLVSMGADLQNGSFGWTSRFGWPDIESAILRLNGVDCTEVCLMLEEEVIGMNITGGFENRYMCYVKSCGWAR